jgi:hypothetical protein
MKVWVALDVENCEVIGVFIQEETARLAAKANIGDEEVDIDQIFLFTEHEVK